jgi:hypothetical protein
MSHAPRTPRPRGTVPPVSARRGREAGHRRPRRATACLAALALATGLTATAAAPGTAATNTTRPAKTTTATTGSIRFTAPENLDLGVRLSQASDLGAFDPDHPVKTGTLAAGHTGTMSGIAPNLYLLEAGYTDPATGETRAQDATLVTVTAGGAVTAPITPSHSAATAHSAWSWGDISITLGGSNAPGGTTTAQTALQGSVGITPTTDYYWTAGTNVAGSGPTFVPPAQLADSPITVYAIVFASQGHTVRSTRYRVAPSTATIRQFTYSHGARMRVSVGKGAHAPGFTSATLTWYRSGRRIARTATTPLGTKVRTRWITKADVGHHITAVVTLRYSNFTPVTLTSKPVTARTLTPVFHAHFRDSARYINGQSTDVLCHWLWLGDAKPTLYRTSRRVTITVGGTGFKNPAGTVTIKWGHDGTTTAQLTAADHGHLHVLAPTAYFKSHTCDTNGRLLVTLTQTRAGRLPKTARRYASRIDLLN